MNHPAVRDGKRLILDVRDVMRPREGLPTCAPEDTLLETLEELNGKGSVVCWWWTGRRGSSGRSRMGICVVGWTSLGRGAGASMRR